MRILIAVIMIVFGVSAIITGSVELYAGGEGGGFLARICYILGGLAGAGVAMAGAGLTRNLIWARLLAYVNLLVMAGVSIFAATQQYGQMTATQHATRAVLALFLIFCIARLRRD
jgi:hypothetical protein